ncbi:MAG: hypothetical protein Q9170_006119 [Blastenia crenularia]
MITLPYLSALIVIASVSVFLRLLYVLPAFNPTQPRPRQKGQPTRLLIVLGSGGHTAEMLSLLSRLDQTRYTHRSYVVSSGDDFSALKAMEFEDTLEAERRDIKQASSSVPSTYDISFVPRARNIHQSLLTTPISSLRCLFACFAILIAPGTQPRIQRPSDSTSEKKCTHNGLGKVAQYGYPDLIIANGPATAVLIIMASLLLSFCNLRGVKNKMRTVYVESWARVSTLSLSGKILVTGGMVNRLLVQWETLALKGQGEFRGALVQ